MYSSTESVAIVLAAGLGARLRDVQSEKPKGFIEMEGIPIIERSIEALKKAGVREFVFVVGWHAEVYRAWCAESCPTAVCVDNTNYATTGSLRSLIIGAALVPGRNIVVVESDLLYEQRAPELLFSAPEMDAVLISGFTNSGDEVWVYDQPPQRLARLTKQRAGGRAPLGELVGLTRLSARSTADLIRAAEALPTAAHYEDGLNALAESHTIDLVNVHDLIWCEIDNPAHLARARETIWPKITAADARRR